VNDQVQPLDVESLIAGRGDTEKAELRLWLRLLSTANLIAAAMRRNLRQTFNVTLPQFDLLAQLEREPTGLRLSELSQRMMVTNGNLTGLVDKLESQGLVVRERSSSDRRAIHVRLTRKGASLFSVMAKAHEAWLARMMADLPGPARKSLMRDLQTLKCSVRDADFD
jgi:DNA-binding MarR family transcriptional regulator